MTDPSSPANMKKIQVVIGWRASGGGVRKCSSLPGLKRQDAEGMPACSSVVGFISGASRFGGR